MDHSIKKFNNLSTVIICYQVKFNSIDIKFRVETKYNDR